MGGKKREDSDVRESVSELLEDRSGGNEAELFSQPSGFIPKFPAPPKYIKVKAQSRKKRDFDRLFLAQILLDNGKTKSRRTSIDSKIHSIDDALPTTETTSKSDTNKAIWAMEFSKDGRYLAAAGQDKKLRVWEIVTSADDRDGGERGSRSSTDADDVKLNAPVFKQKLIREYDGHTSSILDLSWSKNNFLLSSSMDKTVRLYHVSRAECLCAFRHNDFVTSIAFHPRDDRFFLAGSLDSKIRLWSIPDKTVAYWQSVPDMVTAVAFTPDGKTSIAGCLNGMCILYDTEGLKPHSQIHVKSARGKNSKGSKVTGIDTIAVPRENGQAEVKLLITSNDSRIRMYNLKDRNLEIKFRGNENSCSQIHATFSDDGKFVICGSEDRKIYVWPTGPMERPDSDKRPMEVFEAHSTIVTSALLVPTKTRRLLAQSGDPIFDVCNPPPVTLMSRADSVISSRAPSQKSGQVGDRKKSESPKRAAPSPAHLAKHAHVGGHVIVSADYTGQIKIFRQDCAYMKRKQESWDSGSTFSKKMLVRSGSVTTRASVGSSAHRNSLNLGSKNPSADRILSWRNSISANGNGSPTNASEMNLRASVSNDRARSTSPGKSWTKRLSLIPKHAPTPLANPPASPESPNKQKTPPQPTIAIQSPMTPDSSGPPHSAANRDSFPPGMEKRKSSTGLEDLFRSQKGNELMLTGGGQSMMAWNMHNSLLPMAANQPRTPGDANHSNPLSRANSVVSQLSSEIMSSETEEASEEASRRVSVVSAAGEDMKCANCQGSTFKATMTDKGQSLRCKKCGTVVGAA